MNLTGTSCCSRYGGSVKLCNKCGEVKPLSEFHRKTGRKDGRSSTCKRCVNDRVRPYDADTNRDKKLRKAYGITLEDYSRILNDQGGGCAICGSSVDVAGRKLAVDHCHSTGMVRGILCSHCNRGLGFFRDDPERLRAAIRYLGG